jgi:hypothetical protein
MLKDFGFKANGWFSERKRHSTPDRAGRLHQVYCPAILAQDGDVSLSEQIAHIYDCVHVAGEERVFGDGLANEQIKEGIGLPRRSVEHVNWCEGLTVSPAVRSNPAGFRAGQRAAEFRRHALPVSRLQPAMRFFHSYIRLA